MGHAHQFMFVLNCEFVKFCLPWDVAIGPKPCVLLISDILIFCSLETKRAACFEVTFGTWRSSKCVLAREVLSRLVPFYDVKFLLCTLRDLTRSCLGLLSGRITEVWLDSISFDTD